MSSSVSHSGEGAHTAAPGGGASLAPGSVFARDYRVLRPLREGGMGSVHVVEQLSTSKLRALKLLNPSLATDPVMRERFVFEARAASRIESDHVVEVVSAGVDEPTSTPYLVMELLKGEDLSESVRRRGALPIEEVIEIFRQVGHALEQAHSQGIVHRDMKPENIFLAEGRRSGTAFTAKVLDFGVAKLVAEGVRSRSHTQPIGSPWFMAPEQTDWQGDIGPHTDVWALGLIAFHCLTGRDFWREESALAGLMREILIDAIPTAAERAKELGMPNRLPAGFDLWFGKCVSRPVASRFPNAGECVRAFVQRFRPSRTNHGVYFGLGDAFKEGAGNAAPTTAAASTTETPAPAASEAPSHATGPKAAPTGEAPPTSSGAPVRALTPAPSLAALDFAPSASSVRAMAVPSAPASQPRVPSGVDPIDAEVPLGPGPSFELDSRAAGSGAALAPATGLGAQPSVGTSKSGPLSGVAVGVAPAAAVPPPVASAGPAALAPGWAPPGHAQPVQLAADVSAPPPSNLIPMAASASPGGPELAAPPPSLQAPVAAPPPFLRRIRVPLGLIGAALAITLLDLLVGRVLHKPSPLHSAYFAGPLFLIGSVLLGLEAAKLRDE